MHPFSHLGNQTNDVKTLGGNIHDWCNIKPLFKAREGEDHSKPSVPLFRALVRNVINSTHPRRRL